MRFFKRGEYWWCSFPWQGQTLRRSTRCTTRGAALLVAQRWERDRSDPDYAAAQTATLGSAVVGFLAELGRRELSEDTRQMYRQKCGVLNRILGADLPLGDINARLVDGFIEARAKEPVAFDENGSPTRLVTASTIHKELVALRQVLKRARRRGEFRKDPGEVLPVGFSPKYEPRKSGPDRRGGVQAVRKPKGSQGGGCRLRFGHGRTAVGGFPGASRGRRRLDWAGAAARNQDGTRGTGRYRSALRKGTARVRAEKRRRTRGLLVRPWPNARRGLACACKRVGAPAVTWNDLRRTLSTWLVEGGVSDTVVAKVLGHADTKMLHKVYGKPREEAVGELLARQTASLRPVRVLYVSPAEPSGSGPNASAASTGEHSKQGGPSGTRTRDLRIKSPQLYRLSYRPDGNTPYTNFSNSGTWLLQLSRAFSMHEAAGWRLLPCGRPG